MNAENPKLLEKIFPLSGDITLPRCGLSDENYSLLVEKANIIFHVAASINFNKKISTMLQTNVGGIKNVIELAREMKNLEAFVHVSTIFCVPELSELQEKVYDCAFEPLELLHLSKIFSVELMEKISENIRGASHNNYSFSKRLSEVLVRDEFYKRKLPLCIARPSVVLPAYKEPLPGWVDNNNAMSGVGVAYLKGVLRVLLVDPKLHLHVFPVDLTANALITITTQIAKNYQR